MGFKPRQKAPAQRPAPRLAAALPSMFAMLYPSMRETARELGYALALHGSMARDLDVIAVPWTDDAVAPDQLIAALTASIDGFVVDCDAQRNPVQKPHGRLGWAIHLVGSGTYIDISVMPRAAYSLRTHRLPEGFKP